MGNTDTKLNFRKAIVQLANKNQVGTWRAAAGRPVLNISKNWKSIKIIFVIKTRHNTVLHFSTADKAGRCILGSILGWTHDIGAR